MKSSEQMGYTIHVNKKPSVRSSSSAFASLSPDEKRKVLKTEYRLKKNKKASEKNK